MNGMSEAEEYVLMLVCEAKGQKRVWEWVHMTHDSKRAPEHTV